jgi:hypothetical protein
MAGVLMRGIDGTEPLSRVSPARASPRLRHVRRVREHVDGVHRGDAVPGIDDARQLAGQRLGAARHVDDARGANLLEDLPDHGGRAALPRRVEHGRVEDGAAQIRQHVLDATGHQPRAARIEMVHLEVAMRVGDGPRVLFHRQHAVAAGEQRQREEPAARVEIQHVARRRIDGVEHQSHQRGRRRGVGLEERRR